jgi:serine/threonine protein kinase
LPGIDRRTDVYSLGVILYEILEGRPPFRESTRAATVKKVIQDPVPPLSTVGRKPFSSVDREIEAICFKALSKKPEGRHPTTEAFAKELAHWLEKKTVRGHHRGARRAESVDPAADRDRGRRGVRHRVPERNGVPPIPKAPEHPDVLQADKVVAGGDWPRDSSCTTGRSAPIRTTTARGAGREEARRNLLAAALADLDKAMKELDEARQKVEEQRKRPKPQTLDQERASSKSGAPPTPRSPRRRSASAPRANRSSAR